MDAKLIAFLIIGTVAMFLTMLICRRYIEITLFKTVLFSVLLTISGFVSVKLMFFIENGEWNGLSFFGAVIFVPLFLILVSYLIKERFVKLLNLSAPSICVMLALMKVQCLLTGCCKGRVLYENAAGEVVRFPSQIVELANALVIMAILMLFMRKAKYQGKIYPLFMIIYGGTRFLWNLFRQTEPFIWIMPAGNLWALVSIAIGLVWLLILRKKEAKAIS